MKPAAPFTWSQARWWLLGIVCAGGLARFLCARGLPHPGHADGSFYYTVAENVIRGRGLVIDYVWNFLVPNEPLTHPIADFWMPLTSLLGAASFWVCGQTTLLVYLLPNVAMGSLLPLLIFRWSEHLQLRPLQAVVAAGLTACNAPLFLASYQPYTAGPYAFLVVCLLLCIVTWVGAPRRVPLLAWAGITGVVAGLCYLTRRDALLTVPAMLAFVWLWQAWRATRPRRAHLLWSALVLAVAWSVTVAPWVLRNHALYGHWLFPRELAKARLLPTYGEAFYTYDWSHVLQDVTAQGLAPFLARKWNLIKFYAIIPLGLTVPGAVLLLWGWRTWIRQQTMWIGLLFPVMTIVVLGLITSFVQEASVPAIVAILIPAVVMGIWRCADDLAPRRRMPRNFLIGALILGVTLTSMYKCRVHFERAYTYAVVLEQRLAELQQHLDRAALPQAEEVILMTRHPWEVYHTTRRRCVQIPSEDLDTILHVARRYGVTHLLISEPHLRPALAGIYDGSQQDRRIQLVAQMPTSAWKLFRLSFTP